MKICDTCRNAKLNLDSCADQKSSDTVTCCIGYDPEMRIADAVNHPNHYAGTIETIDYIRDKLSPAGFTDYCIGNVMKYISRWRKKDGVQDLKKAAVYLNWAAESAEKENET